ncbi:type 1 glutamine amidotransferase [Desulfothermobacter acidiphilus]|uniref:type 1 glutamine amidotransferase n=1 Tax=Desulfothermobacter acidiphilus TaxID=1938353 RepID=UPI003F897078
MLRSLMVQHVACEGPGLLAEVLSSEGWELDIRVMDQPGATLPETIASYKALIVLGGPMGAYEEEAYPYLYKVQELIRNAISRRVPVLGICLGGQLIARALGAAVNPNAVKEIGWYKIRLTEAGKKTPLFQNLPEEFWVFQWHGDTFDLPEGAILLAKGDTCTNQAFVYRDCAWALQFHLEVTPAMVAHWAEIYREELEDFAGSEASARLKEDTVRQWERDRDLRARFLANLCRVLGG